MNVIFVWIQNRYRKIVNSIAFYPALIALLFLVISYLLITLDFSQTGKQIKSHFHWLSLKDATTARSIISSIVAGIISLSVFSFSNVMIILNQTASQMSNRILNNLIGNRFQQMVLGFYIGTIVFALFLLSTIRDIDSGIYVPAISTYILIAITIFDIFLFIYFLHFITQSVKYEVIIDKIYTETRAVMEKVCTGDVEACAVLTKHPFITVTAGISGIYEGYNEKALVQICDKYNCKIEILKTPGMFVLEDSDLFSTSKELPEKPLDEIRNTFQINNSQSIENNYLYGFRQLTEVALKALSPGINDPGTAVQCLQALSKLFTYRFHHCPKTESKNEEGVLRVITHQLTFEDIFSESVLPIWDYGKDDRLVQHSFKRMLAHFSKLGPVPAAQRLLQHVETAIHNKKI